jgi:hypothetical protein
MFWFIVLAVLVVAAIALRRVLRRRRSPVVDQDALKNANYSRVGQDVTNFDQRYGQHG